MQRVENAADAHHPVFARLAVRAARVQKFDGQQFIPRQCRDCFRQVMEGFDPQKMLPGMKAGSPQQQGEDKAGKVPNVATPEQPHSGRTHAGQAGKSFGIRGAPRLADPRRMVDNGLAAACDDSRSHCKCSAATIGIADGVEDQPVGRQRQFRPVIFHIQDRDGMDAVIQDVLCGNIAAGGRNQHQ